MRLSLRCLVELAEGERQQRQCVPTGRILHDTSTRPSQRKADSGRRHLDRFVHPATGHRTDDHLVGKKRRKLRPEEGIGEELRPEDQDHPAGLRCRHRIQHTGQCNAVFVPRLCEQLLRLINKQKTRQLVPAADSIAWLALTASDG